MKKFIQIAINVIFVLMILFIGGCIYVYNHPIQELTCQVSEGTKVPVVNYTQRFDFLNVPAKFIDQRDEFNGGVQACYAEKLEKYPNDLDLDYDLDKKDGGGVIVHLQGNGTTKAGKKEEFKEELEFPITIRDKSKTSFLDLVTKMFE